MINLQRPIRHTYHQQPMQPGSFEFVNFLDANGARDRANKPVIRKHAMKITGLAKRRRKPGSASTRSLSETQTGGRSSSTPSQRSHAKRQIKLVLSWYRHIRKLRLLCSTYNHVNAAFKITQVEDGCTIIVCQNVSRGLEPADRCESRFACYVVQSLVWR